MAWRRDKPDRYKQGDPSPGASDLNQITDAGVEQLSGRGVSKFGGRFNITPPPPDNMLADHRFYHDRFRVLDVFDNYMLCEPLQLQAPDGWWNPYEYSDSQTPTDQHITVYIALPLLLQREFWDGISITSGGLTSTYEYESLHKRWARGIGFSRLESITEPYFVGDVIVASRGVTGTADPDGKPIFWQDINAAARRWSGPGGNQYVCHMDVLVDSCLKTDGEGVVNGQRQRRARIAYLSPTPNCQSVQTYEVDDGACPTGTGTATGSCVRDCFRVVIGGVTADQSVSAAPDILLFNRTWMLRNVPGDRCNWEEVVPAAYFPSAILRVRLEYCDGEVPLLHLSYEDPPGVMIHGTTLILDAVPPWDCTTNISEPFVPVDPCATGTATVPLPQPEGPITWPTALSVHAVDCFEEPFACDHSALEPCYQLTMSGLTGFWAGFNGTHRIFTSPLPATSFGVGVFGENGLAVGVIYLRRDPYREAASTPNGYCPWYILFSLFIDPCVTATGAMGRIEYRIRPGGNGLYPELADAVPYPFDLGGESSQEALQNGSFPLSVLLTLCDDPTGTATVNCPCPPTPGFCVSITPALSLGNPALVGRYTLTSEGSCTWSGTNECGSGYVATLELNTGEGDRILRLRSPSYPIIADILTYCEPQFFSCEGAAFTGGGYNFTVLREGVCASVTCPTGTATGTACPCPPEDAFCVAITEALVNALGKSLNFIGTYPLAFVVDCEWGGQNPCNVNYSATLFLNESPVRLRVRGPGAPGTNDIEFTCDLGNWTCEGATFTETVGMTETVDVLPDGTCANVTCPTGTGTGTATGSGTTWGCTAECPGGTPATISFTTSLLPSYYAALNGSWVLYKDTVECQYVSGTSYPYWILNLDGTLTGRLNAVDSVTFEQASDWSSDCCESMTAAYASFSGEDPGLTGADTIMTVNEGGDCP